MPRLRGSGRGDQIVRVLVWTPTNLSREERDALERLSEVESEPPAPDSEEPGFWERVKRAFIA
jgi:molecular chaperone DnaJ